MTAKPSRPLQAARSRPDSEQGKKRLDDARPVARNQQSRGRGSAGDREPWSGMGRVGVRNGQNADLPFTRSRADIDRDLCRPFEGGALCAMRPSRARRSHHHQHRDPGRTGDAPSPGRWRSVTADGGPSLVQGVRRAPGHRSTGLTCSCQASVQVGAVASIRDMRHVASRKLSREHASDHSARREQHHEVHRDRARRRSRAHPAGTVLGRDLFELLAKAALDNALEVITFFPHGRVPGPYGYSRCSSWPWQEGSHRRIPRCRAGGEASLERPSPGRHPRSAHPSPRLQRHRRQLGSGQRAPS